MTTVDLPEPNASPHDITDECAPMHCYAHNVDEPATDETYRICYECGHAYQTEAEMVSAYDRMAEALGLRVVTKPTSVGEIAFCPLCTHDW